MMPHDRHTAVRRLQHSADRMTHHEARSMRGECIGHQFAEGLRILADTLESIIEDGLAWGDSPDPRTKSLLEGLERVRVLSQHDY